MYDSKEAIVEPEVISQINVSADVTDLLFVDRYKLLVSLSNGSVALFNYWNKTKVSIKHTYKMIRGCYFYIKSIISHYKLVLH